MKTILKLNLRTLIIVCLFFVPTLAIHAQTTTKMVCKLTFDNIKADTVYVINDTVRAYVNLECTSSKIKMKSPLVLFTPKLYKMKNMDVYIDSDDDIIVRIHENSCEQYKTTADKVEKIDEIVIMKGHASFSYNKTQIEAGNILVITSDSNSKKTNELYDKMFQ